MRYLTTAAAVILLTGMTGMMGARAADSWGIEHEETARVEAKVVDLLCEVAGDCADRCGSGTRQLGLLFDDGRLVPVVKNVDPFAGATFELIEFCGQRVIADGLMINDPQMPMFALQFRRKAPDGPWSRANRWGKAWSAENGGQASGQWFRNDARVRERIEANGVYGIPGLATE